MYEWLGPAGPGRLVLLGDGTLCLSFRANRASPHEMLGAWEGTAIGVVLRDRTSGLDLDALVTGGVATYLGTGGVVDLWWGL